MNKARRARLARSMSSAVAAATLIWATALAAAEPATTPAAAASGPASRKTFDHTTTDPEEFELFVKGFVGMYPAYDEPFEAIPARPFPPDGDGVRSVDLGGFAFDVPGGWSPFATSRPELTAGGLFVSWTDGRGDVLSTVAYLRGANRARVAGQYEVTVNLNKFRREDPALADEAATLDDLALMGRLVEARRTLVDRGRPLADRRQAYLLCNAFFLSGSPVARLVERDGLRIYVSWQPPRPPSRNVATFLQTAVLDVYDVASRRCLGMVAIGLTSAAAHPDELKALALGVASTIRPAAPTTRPVE